MDNFRKASYSQGASNCVETGSGDGQVAVRDTKQADDVRRTVLTVSATSWESFLSGIKSA